MKNQESKHIFAIHVQSNLADSVKDNILELRDIDLRMRVITILRLEKNEPLILFDHSSWIRILIAPQTFEQKKHLSALWRNKLYTISLPAKSPLQLD